MGRFLFDNFQSTQRLFEEASDHLKQDFRKLCFEGSESDLTLTENTQPALLLVSYATFRAFNEVRPLKYIGGSGHSVGEYAALVSSGALEFGEGLKAVRLRGQFMQQAVPVGQGGMLAVIGLSDALVIKMCSQIESESGFKPLQPANFNAPGQVVISGSARATEWARTQFKAESLDPTARKVRLIPLNVSAPFHCSLMQPAEDKMRLVLQDTSFRPAQWPVVQNFTAQAVSEPTILRENLVRQVSGAVRWVECVQQLKKMGAVRCIEFGPGKVLTGLVKKIDSEGLNTFNISSLEDLKILEQMQ